MLQEGGEREGRRVDGGRGRVPQEEEPQGEQPVDEVRLIACYLRYHVILTRDWGRIGSLLPGLMTIKNG